MFWCQSLYEGHDTEAKAPAHRMCKISTKHHLNGHGDEQTGAQLSLWTLGNLFFFLIFLSMSEVVLLTSIVMVW